MRATNDNYRLIPDYQRDLLVCENLLPEPGSHAAVRSFPDQVFSTDTSRLPVRGRDGMIRMNGLFVRVPRRETKGEGGTFPGK